MNTTAFNGELDCERTDGGMKKREPKYIGNFHPIA